MTMSASTPHAWQIRREAVGSCAVRLRVAADGRTLSYRDALDHCQSSPAFRLFLTRTLLQVGYDAFFWETPALSEQLASRDFECVLTEAETLASTRADPNPFAPHFAAAGNAPVLLFPNLGRDALLVVPAPIAAPTCYAHLGVFLRTAPPAQVDAFWATAARAALSQLGPSPRWLSAAGLGVPWLHLRLDSRPKYYRHEAYKHAPA